MLNALDGGKERGGVRRDGISSLGYYVSLVKANLKREVSKEGCARWGRRSAVNLIGVSLFVEGHNNWRYHLRRRTVTRSHQGRDDGKTNSRAHSVGLASLMRSKFAMIISSRTRLAVACLRLAISSGVNHTWTK